MRQREIDFLQSIAEQLLLFCAEARIENDDVEKGCVQFRSQLKIIEGEKENEYKNKGFNKNGAVPPTERK